MLGLFGNHIVGFSTSRLIYKNQSSGVLDYMCLNEITAQYKRCQEINMMIGVICTWKQIYKPLPMLFFPIKISNLIKQNHMSRDISITKAYKCKIDMHP